MHSSSLSLPGPLPTVQFERSAFPPESPSEWTAHTSPAAPQPLVKFRRFAPPCFLMGFVSVPREWPQMQVILYKYGGTPTADRSLDQFSTRVQFHGDRLHREKHHPASVKSPPSTQGALDDTWSMRASEFDLLAPANIVLFLRNSRAAQSARCSTPANTATGGRCTTVDLIAGDLVANLTRGADDER